MSTSPRAWMTDGQNLYLLKLVPRNLIYTHAGDQSHHPQKQCQKKWWEWVRIPHCYILSPLLEAASVPWVVVTSLQSLPPWSHCPLFFCVCLCQISFYLPLIRILVVTFKVHSDKTGKSHFKDLNLLIPFAKSGQIYIFATNQPTIPGKHMGVSQDHIQNRLDASQ